MLVATTPPDAILAALNEPQREAVLHEGSPLLILAGAGSGKTRVLTHRIAWLIRTRGYDPGEIMAVTFTRKAANEMAERVRGLLPEVPPRWWIGTFHAIGARMLREHAPRLGRARDFSIYDQDDTSKLLRLELERLRFPIEITPAEGREMIERAKRDLVTPDRADELAASTRDECLAKLYRQYERDLREMNAFDFSDLVNGPVEIFRAHPEVLEPYAARFRELLVDEYQDTNRVQYLLVAALASRHHGITVVGDDDQSIYAWRGAHIGNILEFERDFPRARVIRLEENYRSTGTILDAAHGLIVRNEGRHDKKLWTRGARGEPVTVLVAGDEEDEARAVVEAVRSAIARSGRRAGDFAVLYRTNAQSRPLEDALRRAMMNYVLVGTVRFYDRREVKDLLAYLRVVLNPKDEVSFRRIVNVPSRGIGPKTVDAMAAWAAAKDVPLADAPARAMEVPGLGDAARSRLLALGRLFGAWRELVARERAHDFARRVADESGYWASLSSEKGHDAEERQENVRELLASIEAYVAENPEATLDQYLEEIALSANVDRWRDEGEAVTLMTLHNAKGLEFPAVFVTGLEEGLLPHRSAIDGARRDLEEERRLLYVGITRAREKVWLTAAARRRGAAGPGGPRLLSRFVGEIPAEHLHFIELEQDRWSGGGGRWSQGDRRPGPAERVRLRAERFSRGASHQDDDGLFSEGGGGREREENGDLFRRGPDDDDAGARRAAAGAHAAYEAPEAPSGDWVDARRLTVGSWVRHPEWGRGKVLSREGDGANLALVILFGGTLRKKVLARFAKLEAD